MPFCNLFMERPSYKRVMHFKKWSSFLVYPVVAELVRNSFINERVTVKSRERLSRTSKLQYNSTGRHLAWIKFMTTSSEAKHPTLLNIALKDRKNLLLAWLKQHLSLFNSAACKWCLCALFFNLNIGRNWKVLIHFRPCRNYVTHFFHAAMLMHNFYARFLQEMDNKLQLISYY